MEEVLAGSTDLLLLLVVQSMGLSEHVDIQEPARRVGLSICHLPSQVVVVVLKVVGSTGSLVVVVDSVQSLQ